MKFDVSYQTAMFFIGIAVVLFAKSESKSEYGILDQHRKEFEVHDKLISASTNSIHESLANDKTATLLETTSTPLEPVPLSSNKSPPQYFSQLPPPNLYILPFPIPKKQVKCEPLNQRYYMTEVANSLSPEILSQADPFSYLVDKTMKMNYRAYSVVGQTLKNYIQTDELPRCYVPYAKVLSSLLQCWPDLKFAKDCIISIQWMFPKSSADFSFLPFDTSLFLSPQLLELFSAEIFSDPTPPLRIFYKLINMPKNDVRNLDAPLGKFVEKALKGPKIPFRNLQYIWYGRSVWRFIHNASVFDDLQQGMAEIRRLANSDLPTTSTE